MKSRTRKVWVAVAWGALALASVPWAPRFAEAAPAKTDPAVARAKELFDKAETEFQLGHHAEALALYEEAFRAKAFPEFLYNIGLCHQHLGNSEKAAHSFRTYLAKTPKASNREQVQKWIAELDEKVKSAAPTVVVAAPASPPGGATPVAPAPSPAQPPSAEPVAVTAQPVPQSAPAYPAYGYPPPAGANQPAPGYPPPAGANQPAPGYPPGQAPYGYLTTQPLPQQKSDSLVGKPWFWVTVAGVVVAAVVVGVLATSSSGAKSPTGSLGTVDLR